MSTHLPNTNNIFIRLNQSPFRRKFHLQNKDLEYIADKGNNIIRQHAENFIRLRLAPSFIANDGKQTPMRGHPVFIAQHATATCCRSCLLKWHKIEKERELTLEEQTYIVNIIMKWINNQKS